MFEAMTYENILSTMIQSITSDVDKREGSIIYDALAPCAYQLAQNYFLLNNFIDLLFSDTAVGEYLDRRIADFGLKRKQATKAIRKIITMDTQGIAKSIEVGTRFAINDITLVVIGEIVTGQYKAECEQYGEIGNAYNGALQPIDNLSGLGSATLTDILISGQDEETDENLRARFYNRVQMPATSGNAYHYKQWALEVEGVGDCKVFPLWDGPGTVKILVVDSDKTIDETLEITVANHIEELRPIGATVTVDSPTSKTIGASANISLDGTKTLDEVISTFTINLAEYLKGTVFRSSSISYAMIGSLLLTTEGVRDYENLLVNGGFANISIGNEEISVVGSISLEAVI